MAKGDSLHLEEASSQSRPSANYDYLKTVVAVAKKNGWDLDSLGLVQKDLPSVQDASLTRKQMMERTRMVKSILKRFSKILTPPVPMDLEKSIKNKDQGALLPWEEEVLEKAKRWRRQMKKAKPEIVQELRRAIMTAPDPE